MFAGISELPAQLQRIFSLMRELDQKAISKYQFQSNLKDRKEFVFFGDCLTSGNMLSRFSDSCWKWLVSSAFKPADLALPILSVQEMDAILTFNSVLHVQMHLLFSNRLQRMPALRVTPSVMTSDNNGSFCLSLPWLP